MNLVSLCLFACVAALQALCSSLCWKDLSDIHRLMGGGDKNICEEQSRKLDNHFLLQELEQLPGTSAEFYRDWRRCLKSGKEKYQLLLKLEGKALSRIFQAELGFGLLGEFLTVLAQNVCHEDRDAVLQILQSLSGTKRFGLNLDLLSTSEKESTRDLFRKLQSMSGGYWTPGRPCGKAEGEAHPTDTDLQKEAEERRVTELMRCYQAS